MQHRSEMFILLQVGISHGLDCLDGGDGEGGRGGRKGGGGRSMV